MVTTVKKTSTKQDSTRLIPDLYETGFWLVLDHNRLLPDLYKTGFLVDDLQNHFTSDLDLCASIIDEVLHVCYVIEWGLYVPEVDLVEEVPGRGVTDHFATVIRFLDHGFVPEWIRHLGKTQRREEFIGSFKHLESIVALRTRQTR